MASNAWHWLGLRYFWLLHGFLPALRPNGGSCPEIPGAACGEVSSNGRRASRQACTGRPAVIWGPPQNFRELRKKGPEQNYTSPVFAYYWRLGTRQADGRCWTKGTVDKIKWKIQGGNKSPQLNSTIRDLLKSAVVTDSQTQRRWFKIFIKKGWDNLLEGERSKCWEKNKYIS